MGGCKEAFKREFKPSNFGLNHEAPELFVVCQWNWHPFVYMFYCIVWMLYTVTWCVLSGALPGGWYSGEENRVKWFIYLTNWQYLVITILVIIKAATVAVYTWRRRNASGDEVMVMMPWYLKMSWVFHNMAFVLALVVGLAYWVLLFPNKTVPLDVVDVHTHGITILYVFTDAFVTAIPIRVYHFFHSVVFCIIYLVFSIIYTYVGGTNSRDKPYIYNGVLDWIAAPSWTAVYVVVLVLVAVPLVHLVNFGLFKMRVFLRQCCCRSKIVVETTDAVSIETHL